MIGKQRKFILEVPIFSNKNPIETLQITQGFDCDFISLKFDIETEAQIPSAANLLEKLLPYIEKPLMIRGVNKDATDIDLLPKLMQVLDRESIIAFANENTYKKIVPPVIAGNHTLVLRTPIDINLAKEMNILSNDLGLSLDKILIDTDIGGLGCGFEYGYSIMEKINLEDDKFLNMPMITFAAEESLKTKETKSDSFSKSYGTLNSRIKMFELAASASAIAAGAEYIVLNHPQNLQTMRRLF